jgi:signal transduction histidine kinase/DNA-binding response OmpR family regulator
MKQSKILKKLLTASERSFIIIDRDFLVIDSSYGAERFSENPYESIFQKDIRDVFPETIGLEETFNNIWLNQTTSFELKGIFRSTSANKPLYFDFYIIGTNELEESDKNIIICIEDTTELMVVSQSLMQRANEAELLANALKKSNEYIDKIISTMADALVVTDNLGRIKTINPATVNLFGYSQTELIGSSIAILLKESEQLSLFQHNSHNNQALNSDRNSQSHNSQSHNFQNIEIACLSKTKEEFIISFSCSTIFNHQLEYLQNNVQPTDHFVYIGRNITEIKRKEQELLAARQIAEQSAQAKSVFLANMSHEIRTPINGVLGMTEILLGTVLNERQQDFVESIRLSGNLLLSLINRILDLSKLEEGKLELENLSFHLEACIEESLEIFALAAEKKGLSLNAVLEDDLPVLLLGDTVRLRQILINLIGNAIKFTDQGEVLVRVERDRNLEKTLATSLDNQLNNQPDNQYQIPFYLRFSICDTGIGIDPQDHDKLFKPFSQVDASTTRRFGGTGLGLSICQQLVSLMQGQIGVSSWRDDQSGTCFWFTIPFYPQAKNKSPASREYAQALAGKSVLIVDGNPHTRDSIAYYLRSFGAEIYSAANKLELIAHLDTNTQIDVVLIDQHDRRSTDVNQDVNQDVSQDVNQMELIQQIRAEQLFANLPLIALLNSNFQGDLATLTNQGFCGYLTKPVQGQRLLKTILSALNIGDSSTFELSPIDKFSSPSTNFLFDEITMNTDKFMPVIESSPEASPVGKLNNLRIVLAEDNLVNQKVMIAYLTKLNCVFDLAENGEEVLKLVKSKDYDIILMDCQMPLLDGYDTTQAIRQLEASNELSKHIIIIAMTANAFAEDRDRCLASGMDDYLSKPLRRQQLQETLERWMQTM